MSDSAPPDDPRPRPPAPGDVLAGKYRVEHTLGMGGMGVVVKARHIDLDEPVAIKLLLPHVQPHGEPVARFLREARAAIKIKSEHVVRVFDVGRLENAAPFIVMEYLEGKDLALVVDERGPLPVREVVDCVMQVCEALVVAHAQGIVHRDLKPANLFLTTGADGEPCVKVLDFGISKVTGPLAKGGLTTTSAIMGTPCFMSPEQLRATRDVDGRADIWSLGAIFYALLTGAPPYDGESNADVSAKIIRDAPRPLRDVRPDVPEALAQVVQRCLEKNVAARFQSVAELSEALGPLGSEASQKSVQRVARAGFAVAPTLRSSEPAPALVPSIAPVTHAPVALSSARSSAPTGTASAWGKQEAPAAPRRPARASVIAGAAALVVALLGIGFVVRQSRVPAPSLATPGLASVIVPVVASAPLVASSPAPSASAPSAPSHSAKSASSSKASAAPMPSSSVYGSALLGAPGSVRAGAPAMASAPAASSAPPAKLHGLFDERE